MDYGKTAYLKIVDIEQRLGALKTSNNNFNQYLELSKPSVNETINKNSIVTIEFPEFEIKGNVCFQIKANITISSGGNLDAQLLVNNLLVHEENLKINNSTNNIIILKTYQPLQEGKINVKLKFSTDEELLLTIDSIDLIVLGASGENVDLDIELRALKTDSTHALVSYIDDNKLYYQTISIEEKNLPSKNFQYHSNAISHCFCQKSYNESTINLYKVDLNNNLYLTQLNSNQQRLLESDVRIVYACPCPNLLDDTNLIVYIKTNGECYYRTMRENNLVNERKLNIPKGPYKDIRCLSHENSEYCYIIATHENGSNYLIKSQIEVSTGKIIENLESNYEIILSKYLELGQTKTIENLSAKMEFSLELKNEFEEAVERLGRTHLYLGYSIDAEKYKIIPPIVWGVDIDPEKYQDPEAWVTYCDDCADFLPASYDYKNHILTDNGWTSRWPFNEIRPCVIKNDTITYLNKDNYDELEDGTPIDTSDKNIGEIMVEFPKIYFKIWKNEKGHIRLNLSNKALDGYTCEGFVYKGVEHDKVYISAYLCGTNNYNLNGFHSRKGTKYITNKGTSYMNLRSVFESTREENYELLNYFLLELIQIMFIIFFKTTRSRYTLGLLNDTSTNPLYSGATNKNGMFYGEESKGYGVVTQTKLFGLEDFFGARNTFVIGFYIGTDEKIHLIDPYDPNVSYDYKDLEKYRVIEGDYHIPDVKEHLALDINGSNYTGFFHMGHDPTKYSDSYNIGFCNHSRAARCNGGGYISFGVGINFITTYTGIFSMFVEDIKTFKWDNCVRLVYYPKT